MAAVINTNMPSLNAQRHLSGTHSALERSLQRLSSGLRINSSKDDAAGLGICERMTTQIRGMNQAIRNANDGISLAQTIEGAMGTISDMLQRIRELAVQSSNATNSPSDREALQAEVGQLTTEINRIAQTAAFNGQKVLDGTMGTQHFQVGANAGETMPALGLNLLSHTYGNNRVENEQVKPQLATTNVVPNQEVVISGYLGSQTYTTIPGAPGPSDTAQTIAEGINRLTPQTGVTARAVTEINLSMTPQAYSFDLQSDNAEPLRISFTVTGSAATATDFAAALNAINSQTAKTGVFAEFDHHEGGIKLTNMVGNDIIIENVMNTDFYMTSYEIDGTVDVPANCIAISGAGIIGHANGRVIFDSMNSFSVDDQGSGLVMSIDPVGGTTIQGSRLMPVSTLDVSNFKNAQTALVICDAAILIIVGQRAQYGALQARFEGTINSLMVSAENCTASRSRIMDADFAQETAALSRATILQQSGITMLAQANQIPQSVLNLLR